MKKIITSFFFCAVLSVMLLVPAFAEGNAVSDATHTTTYNRAMDGTTVAPGVNTYGTNRAIAPGVNTYGTNYRTTATTTDGRRYNWGWLGLLGLIGLAGLRGRNHERA